jgi:hypothetical protein
LFDRALGYRHYLLTSTDQEFCYPRAAIFQIAQLVEDRKWSARFRAVLYPRTYIQSAIVDVDQVAYSFLLAALIQASRSRAIGGQQKVPSAGATLLRPSFFGRFAKGVFARAAVREI